MTFLQIGSSAFLKKGTIESVSCRGEWIISTTTGNTYPLSKEYVTQCLKALGIVIPPSEVDTTHEMLISATPLEASSEVSPSEVGGYTSEAVSPAFDEEDGPSRAYLEKNSFKKERTEWVYVENELYFNEYHFSSTQGVECFEAFTFQAEEGYLWAGKRNFNVVGTTYHIGTRMFFVADKECAIRNNEDGSWSTLPETTVTEATVTEASSEMSPPTSDGGTSETVASIAPDEEYRPSRAYLEKNSFKKERTEWVFLEKEDREEYEFSSSQGVRCYDAFPFTFQATEGFLWAGKRNFNVVGTTYHIGTRMFFVADIETTIHMGPNGEWLVDNRPTRGYLEENCISSERVNEVRMKYPPYPFFSSKRGSLCPDESEWWYQWFDIKGTLYTTKGGTYFVPDESSTDKYRSYL